MAEMLYVHALTLVLVFRHFINKIGATETALKKTGHVHRLLANSLWLTFLQIQGIGISSLIPFNSGPTPP